MDVRSGTGETLVPPLFRGLRRGGLKLWVWSGV